MSSPNGEDNGRIFMLPRIWCGFDVNQLQNTVAENLVVRWSQLLDLLDDLAHLVDSIDTFVWACRMCWNAEGFYHDFGTSALSDLHVQLGSFADDDVIRFDIGADFFCSNALKTFLMDNACNIDVTREVIVEVLCIVACSCQHSGQCALHIRGAAAVHFAVHNFSGKWIVVPCGRIADRNGVHMSIEQNLWTWFAALDVADAVAVLVHINIGEVMSITESFHLLHNLVFLSAVAWCLNHFLGKGYQFISSFVSQH